MIDLKLVQDTPSEGSRYYIPSRVSNGADRIWIAGYCYRLDYVALPNDDSEPLVAVERQTRAGHDYKGERGRRVLLLSDLGALDPAGLAGSDAIAGHVQRIREALVRVLLDEHRTVAATEVARDDVDYRAGDRTLFPADPSTEHMLPSLAGDLDLRVVARVGAVQLTRDWQRVLDQRSGLWVEVRRASCGGDCECAGEVRLTEQPEPAPAPSWGGPAATISVDESVPLDVEEDAPEGTLTHWQPCSNGDGRRTMHASGLCSQCRQLDATMREQMAQHPEHEAEPVSASTVPTDCKVCGQEIEPSPLVPAGEEPLWQHVHPSARREPDCTCSPRLTRTSTWHRPDCPTAVANAEQAMRTIRAEHAREEGEVDRQPAWPDDTLALLTVGELRKALGDAVLAVGAHPAPAIVERLIRELPIPPEERAAHGLPDVGRPESFERPGSAYDGVLGYDAEHRAVVPSSTSRLVRLATHHPEPQDCKGDEYGTWLAVGSTLGEFLAEGGAPLTAGDIRVLAAHHNVSPFAVLDLLDKRGIAHEPNPALVPEDALARDPADRT